MPGSLYDRVESIRERLVDTLADAIVERDALPAGDPVKATVRAFGQRIDAAITELDKALNRVD